MEKLYGEFVRCIIDLICKNRLKTGRVMKSRS